MATDSPESINPIGEISQGPNAFDVFMDRHQKSLILLAVVGALGVCVFLVVRGINRSKEETAGAALYAANDQASLEKVISEYPNTDAAGSAVVELADYQWTSGDQAAAIATLQDFLSGTPDHPAVSSARASLAAKWFSQGKLVEAEREFRQLLDQPGARFLVPYALVSLGDLAQVNDQLESAKNLYEQVRAEYPASPFAQVAAQRLQFLGAELPEVITAPPPPPIAPSTASSEDSQDVAEMPDVGAAQAPSVELESTGDSDGMGESLSPSPAPAEESLTR